MTNENALEEYLHEDENGKHKLIYAYFGLSVYKSQCLEETFSNMLLLHRICNKSLNLLEDIDKEILNSSKKTMGNLIREVRNEYNFTDKLEEDLLEILNKRNYLVHKYFKDNIVYINVMKNMSVDCDCCAVAEDPCMKDIGILISTDPIAIDQACLDLVYASDDPGKEHLIERIESRNGVHTIEAAEALGYGSRDYELIEIES